ncbi:Helix-turn-helix domain-containing protein [Ruminococcaceae bacterium YRB3002]|nr:Helix-turn-helix domain-containing protein [Ruminococcaceae bacterium YRB3002]
MPRRLYSDPDYIININGEQILLEEVKQKIAIDLGTQIRESRKERGLTQAALAKLSGVERANIARIENGNLNTTFGTVIRLAEALGMRISINLIEKAE